MNNRADSSPPGGTGEKQIVDAVLGICVHDPDTLIQPPSSVEQTASTAVSRKLENTTLAPDLKAWYLIPHGAASFAEMERQARQDLRDKIRQLMLQNGLRPHDYEFRTFAEELSSDVKILWAVAIRPAQPGEAASQAPVAPPPAKQLHEDELVRHQVAAPERAEQGLARSAIKRGLSLTGISLLTIVGVFITCSVAGALPAALSISWAQSNRYSNVISMITLGTVIVVGLAALGYVLYSTFVNLYVFPRQRRTPEGALRAYYRAAHHVRMQDAAYNLLTDDAQRWGKVALPYALRSPHASEVTIDSPDSFHDFSEQVLRRSHFDWEELQVHKMDGDAVKVTVPGRFVKGESNVQQFVGAFILVERSGYWFLANPWPMIEKGT